MRFAAVFQIISTLASMAILTLPAAQALPVRGALGSLGARARAAKRAAHYHAQQHPIMPEQVVVESSAPSASAVNDLGKRKRNEIKRSVTATATESSTAATRTAQPIKRSFIDGLAQIVADNVVASIPVLPQNNAAIVEPAAPASLETPAAVADAGAIYASYIAALGDAPSTILPSSSSSSSSTSELDVAPTAFVVAAVQAVPVSSSTVDDSSDAGMDQQAIYQSYIAAMDQPTTGVWATATST